MRKRLIWWVATGGHSAGLAVLAAVLALPGCTPKIDDDDVDKAVFLLADVQRLVDRAPESTLIIDARAPSDFAAGHIPGSRNMQITEVPEGSTTDPALARYKTIIVYGNDPASPPARALTKRLLAAGYSNVHMYRGGLAEWRRAGLPIETAGASSGG